MKIKREVQESDIKEREIKFPFIKKGILKTKKIKFEDKPLKEPVLFLLKSDWNIRIYEKVEPGALEITKDDKDKTKVTILLPPSKLLSWNYGNDSVRGWFASEQEAVAYPTDILHDSQELQKIIEQLKLNYKNYRAQTLTAYSKLLWTIILGIAIILGMIWYFKIPIFGGQEVQVVEKIVQVDPATVIYNKPT